MHHVVSVSTPLLAGALALLASACLAAEAWRDVATAHEDDALAATAYLYVEGPGATVDDVNAVDGPRDAVVGAHVQGSHGHVAGRLHRLRQASADAALGDHSARAPPETGAGPSTDFAARLPGCDRATADHDARAAPDRPDAVPDDAEAQHDPTLARASRTQTRRDTVLLAYRRSRERATGSVATEEP
jgi:hypothetical protein